MNTNKWLYFRDVTDTDDDDGKNVTIDKGTSLLVNADRLISMQPATGTLLYVNFEPVKHLKVPGSGYTRTHTPVNDRIRLTIADNTHEAVMESITEAITSPNGNSFIDVIDLVTTLNDESTKPVTKINTNISSAAIDLYKTPQGHGMHEYFEVVTPMAASHDNDVVASLNIKLPAQAIVLEAAMTTLSVATNDVGSVALELWDTAIADDSNSAGTEFLGADSTGGLSIPDLDLDISSNAPTNSTIHSGTTVPVDTATLFSSETDSTYLHITAKEDMSSMTGTPKVGVYLRWFGPAAIALA
jgi:hypothetical protein